MTLKWTPWLIAVSAIHTPPYLLAVLARARLYPTPVGDGFDPVSSSASIRNERLKIFRRVTLGAILF